MAFSQSVYSFQDVICILGGIKLSGFAEGDDCIIIARRTDVITPTVGADGNATIAKSADKSVDITIKLLDTSISNSIIQDLLTTSDLIYTIPFPIQIQDLGGLDTCVCSAAVVSKAPDLQFGAGANTREWKLFSNTAIIYRGGHLV